LSHAAAEIAPGARKASVTRGPGDRINERHDTRQLEPRERAR